PRRLAIDPTVTPPTPRPERAHPLLTPRASVSSRVLPHATRASATSCSAASPRSRDGSGDRLAHDDLTVGDHAGVDEAEPAVELVGAAGAGHARQPDVARAVPGAELVEGEREGATAEAEALIAAVDHEAPQVGIAGEGQIEGVFLH